MSMIEVRVEVRPEEVVLGVWACAEKEMTEEGGEKGLERGGSG
jgi:hypothetical protein